MTQTYGFFYEIRTACFLYNTEHTIFGYFGRCLDLFGYFGRALSRLWYSTSTWCIRYHTDYSTWLTYFSPFGQVVRLLLGAGAVVDAAASDNGETPLYLAAYSGNAEVVRARYNDPVTLCIGCMRGIYFSSANI